MDNWTIGGQDINTGLFSVQDGATVSFDGSFSCYGKTKISKQANLRNTS